MIVETADENRLRDVMLPGVQAVVFTPPQLPGWFEGLRRAVVAGAWQVPRTVLDEANAGTIAHWLDTNLPLGVVDPDVRNAVHGDLMSLVRRVAEWTGATTFMFRILTDSPSRHCGFHVDTVRPGLPPWGLLRVYNGAGTDYVVPDNVTTMRDFYRYLSRRERLVRDRDHDEIERLDAARTFLREPDKVRVATAGSIVTFKHLDVRQHWSDHDKALAWIHCSPMAGEPRFLANVTPSGVAARFDWRARRAATG